jgi:hypothetical protein
MIRSTRPQLRLGLLHAVEPDSECSASPPRSDTLASLGPKVRLAGDLLHAVEPDSECSASPPRSDTLASLGPKVRLVSCSFAVLGLLACRTPSSKIPLEKLSADEQGDQQGETREAIEPLPVERPTDLLPPEVAVMAEAIDPSALLALLGPLDKYQELDSARAELRGQLGADIFDAEQWDELGIDSHKPAGIGMLDVASEAFFAYLSLVDEAKFEQTLLRVVDMVGAREEFASTEVAGSRVYRLNREVNVVVRDRIALLLFADDPDAVPRDYVVTAATIDPRESLGHSEQFVWARQQLQAADDGMLFINPPELLAQIGREQSNDDYGVRYAEEELARARAAGESPQVIRDREARLEEERRWQREREAERAGERELVSALFGSITGFVGAADLRNDGIVAHARLLIPSPSLLRRMFLAPEHESPLLTALGEPPVFALDGRVDLQVLLEAVELIARAEGQTLDTLNREIKVETGVDVVLGVIPTLTGEGGIMLTETRKPDVKKLGEVQKSLGLAGHAGLKDPEAMRRLLDGIARDKLLAGALARSKRGDGWVLSVPKWREVELSIVGDRLVVATDSKLAGRIRNAERGSQADALALTEHPLRGPLANPAARMYWRMIGFVLLDSREPWKQDAESMLYDMNTHHSLTPDEAAKVPRSRDFKNKLGELQKAVDDLNAYNVRRAQREFEQELALAEGFGDLGMQVEPLVDGLGLTANWRFAKGTTPLELGFMVFRIDSGTDWDEYERLNTRTYELVNELRAIRQADLDAAAANRKPN